MTKSYIDLEPILTPAEVAQIFRVSRKTVTRWENEGKIRSVMTMGGQRRYEISEIRRLLTRYAPGRRGIMIEKFKVVTICGSMRYYNDMLDLASKLTSEGHIVLMPFVKKGEGSTDIRMLDRMHLAKIDMCDCIYVVGSHIGESTSAEIKYAQEHGHPIHYVRTKV